MQNTLQFQTDFEISREKTLRQLSKGHLMTLISAYGLRKPPFPIAVTKSSLQNYVDIKIRKHYPEHPVDAQTNELIFTPRINYSTEC